VLSSKHRSASLPLVLAVFLAGCAPHAIDTEPDVLINPASKGAYSAGGNESHPMVSHTSWYESFGDEKLNALMAEALSRNYDIRQALARLDQADAIARQSRADIFPVVDATAAARDSEEDGDGQEGVTELGAALSWEVDAFGRLRSIASSDRMEAVAAAEDVLALRLSLSAEVAEAYYGAMAQKKQLALLTAQAETDRKLLNLTDLRFTEGVGTNVDVLQQKSQVAETESLIPPAEGDLRVFENRLDVLLGLPADAADRTEDSDILDIPPALPVTGIPSDLILNRPDLRAIRNRLVAADADIAAAIADRLPRITLDGSILVADGPNVSGPVSSVLLGLVQPLLDWGKRKAEVERNEALYEEGLAAFTQVYLEAIEDVENALYQENRQREYIARLDNRRAILQQTVEQTESLYREGLNDYLPVLSALQDLRRVERDLIAQQRALISFRIQLYRALGGPLAPPMPARIRPVNKEGSE